MKKIRPFDFGIFIVILMLLVGGIIMIASASSVNALARYGNSYYLLERQMIWAAIGIIAMLFVSKIDYHLWGKFSNLVYLVSVVLLILVLIPHIGAIRNGAQRWINLGITDFQPSEVAKLGIIVFLSYRLTKDREKLGDLVKGLIPFIITTVIVVGLLLLEPHKSCAIIILLLTGILIFTAGAKMSHIAAAGALAGIAGFALIMKDLYSSKRIFTFLNPWVDPRGDGWQTIQSLYAIGSGGIFGLGLGRSRQKFLYIPEPQNDFIFSILAEELGFIGVVTIIILFLIFMWRGIRIAMKAPDVFGSLLATGLTSLVAVQVLINIAVDIALLPVTGVPLPFFSYGGSSLCFLMIGMGILLNISRSVSNSS